MLDLSLVALALAAMSGAPGLVCSNRSRVGQRLTAALLVAGALLGVVAAFASLAGGSAETRQVTGALPGLVLRVRLDPLSAFFLVPVYVLGAVGALYGGRYWSQAEHPENAVRLRLCFGLLIGALAGIALAADGVAFLLAWETMALSAFLLITTEDEQPEVREAGWIYLVSAHVGTLALFAFFALWWSATGSLELQPWQGVADRPGVTSALFLLALLGFGLKAGIVPLHFWLPAAHANAPSHVSAVLSGVMLKIGIYGLMRVLTLLPAPPTAAGMTMLGLGAVSALYGVIFALGQHDLKRLLAYHSVENVGIIVMGLGLASIGVSARQPTWIALGLGGALLHVWNHALFKALLFLTAGGVIHGTGTREIDRLGGLARSMPRTAALFAVGAAAICGLPPLNGFVSELLIYVGLLRVDADGSAGAGTVAPLAAPLLAMAGALALACFVKVFGAVFLGPSRSEAAAGAHECPRSMLFAMTPLAVGCVGIGVLPVLLTPVLDQVVRAWVGFAPAALPPLSELVPWRVLMATNAALIASVLAGALWVRARSARRGVATTVTWDCGYARPTPRMAYTASSFAASLVELYGWLLGPRSEGAVPTGLFPGPRSFHSAVRDPVLASVLAPLWARLRRVMALLRVVQRGPIQQYLVYVLVTLCLLLGSLFSVEEAVRRLLGW